MTLEGNPWFVAPDCCRALGLNANVAAHTGRLLEDEKRVLTKRITGPTWGTPEQLGINQIVTQLGAKMTAATLISESGLYKLIMRSDKPQARPFQDWVTREVLPSIRKTGAYELPKGEVMPLPDKALLTLVTREFQGQPMWAVDHPEHGELLMAKHVLLALGYDGENIRVDGTGALLNQLKVDAAKRHKVFRYNLDQRSLTLPNGQGGLFPSAGANFLDRLTVRKVAMACTLPPAKEFREWLADVSIKIEDTGGYLLNEAARETAFADARTTIPLPAEIAGGYKALIEARKAEIAARETAFAEEKSDSSAAERMNIRLCPPRRPHRKRPTFCVSHAPTSPLRWPPWPPHTPLCPTRSALRCSL